MNSVVIQIVPLSEEHQGSVCEFFRQIDNPTYRGNFAPHPFTDAEAHRICAHQGRDMYVGVFALTIPEQMVGYGMLRGLDEVLQGKSRFGTGMRRVFLARVALGPSRGGVGYDWVHERPLENGPVRKGPYQRGIKRCNTGTFAEASPSNTADDRGGPNPVYNRARPT